MDPVKPNTEEGIIMALQEKITHLEQINDQMLTIILEQSKHIRYMEDMNKVKRL